MPTINVVHIVFELWCAFFCVVCTVVVYSNHEHTTQRGSILGMLLLENALLLVCDVLAWTFRGNPSRLGYYMVRFSNFETFALGYLEGFGLLIYVLALIEINGGKPSKWWFRSAFTVFLTGFLLLIVSQFTNLMYYFDTENFYHRAANHWISPAIPLIIIVLSFLLLIYHIRDLRKDEFWMLLMMVSMPILVIPVQMLYYGISLSNIASSLMLCIEFMNYEVVQSRRARARELEFARQEAALAQKDLELMKSRNQIMMSQIRPHFMFNCLGSISMLCRLDPKKAGEATDYFAQYLRTNLDSLSVNTPVPFADELRHIRAYIWLEKMRFEDDLDYVEDIQTEAFRLPLLSVQPILENAVKHGMRGLAEGVLRVTLRTEETPDAFVITVADDGPGFDMNQKQSDGRSHVGLQNVKDRIRTMAGGTCTLHSEVGKGTTAEIRIPK